MRFITRLTFEIQMVMDKGLSALLLTPVEPEGKLSTTWANVKQQY